MIKPPLNWTIAFCVVSAVAGAQGSVRVTGCWQSDRPLGPAGGVEPVLRDNAFRTVVLRDSGRIAFPMISTVQPGRAMWERRSSWSAKGDSVTIRTFTGLQGWHAELKRTSAGDSLRGVARYLTDAIAKGAPPLRVPVVFARIACAEGWPTVASTIRSLRGWERGDPLYFPHQVDEDAVLVPGSPLPAGVTFARPLRADEQAKTASDRIGARVVLQFVIESSGRADTTNVRILFADDTTQARRIAGALPSLRFVPARKFKQPVHVGAHWLFELRVK